LTPSAESQARLAQPEQTDHYDDRATKLLDTEKSKSFEAPSDFKVLLATQFLGALNDHALKIVVVLFAVDVSFLAEAQSTYLALAGAFYVLPFLLFAGVAGRVTDTYDKRIVTVGLKFAELAVMLGGLVAFYFGRIEALFALLFLMATQSAFFSPVRQALLAERIPAKRLTMANGYFEIAIFAAIILGTILGSALYDATRSRPEFIGVALIIVAAFGAVTSCSLRKGHCAPERRHRPSFHRTQPLGGLLRILTHRPLGPVVAGISYFWFIGVLLQLDLIALGKQVMQVGAFEIGLMQAALGVGLAAGGIVAGALCRGGVNLRFVPHGLIIMSASALLLPFVLSSYFLVLLLLVIGGLGGGVFVVPLNAYLQAKTISKDRGRTLAANNFFNMLAVLFASLVLWVFLSQIEIGPHTLILLIGGTHVLVLCSLLGVMKCRRSKRQPMSVIG
jgi:acyl-[acyl-carrier-protein]-phospholipid O-acyltransferase/long-chain-fatty-acid--[acyl-carrier-protein] ligase